MATFCCSPWELMVAEPSQLHAQALQGLPSCRYSQGCWEGPGCLVTLIVRTAQGCITLFAVGQEENSVLDNKGLLIPAYLCLF